jgi:general L-amino acid transport system substrate-binding protein
MVRTLPPRTRGFAALAMTVDDFADRYCLRAAIVLLFSAVLVPACHAGAVLDRVTSEGVVRCGGQPRPGLVSVGSNGQAAGLLLDLCRAIGAAVLGPNGRLEFYPYESSKSYDAVRNNNHDVVFLSASEMLEQGLAGKLLPVAPVFFQTTAVMVSESSTAQHLSDLAGRPICFPIAGNSNRHLEAWFAAHHLDFIRMGFQEEVEMNDAYNVQVCKGLAGEVTSLAEVRLDGGVNELRSRILSEPLAAFPIMAATGTKDAEWSAVVAWTIHTLVRAESPTSYWATGGAESLPIEAPELKLLKGWQKRVVDAVGTYGDIYRRNLGEGSPYRLPRGLNAPWRDGGLFLAPYAE